MRTSNFTTSFKDPGVNRENPLTLPDDGDGGDVTERSLLGVANAEHRMKESLRCDINLINLAIHSNILIYTCEGRCNNRMLSRVDRVVAPHGMAWLASNVKGRQ